MKAGARAFLRATPPSRLAALAAAPTARATPAGSVRPAPARAPYLRIRGLSKAFGGFTAIRDVDLEIFEGELVCFLGPSGCGKTTLLRAIAGLSPQTSGTIEQGGRDISALPPARRDFGIVFQSYALFPNLTVAQNVGYGLVTRRVPKAGIEARVDELLAMVGLPGSGRRYPAQLSGGQQQRVALARALATSPGLLLLDEPLSALDARVRAHLRHEIKQLTRRLGLTTILVTHDQEEALAMADRIVVMNHGAIDQIGTPLEIYRAPATRFVADFVGKMNAWPACLEGTRHARAGSLRFELGEESGAADLADPGAAVTLCVRPEDVVVGAAAAPAANSFEAVIEDLEFLGSFFRASLSSAELGNGPLMADLPVQMVREHRLAAGGRVPVAVPAERIRVFAVPTSAD